jgi:hypothetical protein
LAYVGGAIVMAFMTKADVAQNARAARARGGTIGLQGRRRQLAIAEEAETERQNEAAKLLADLGRPASHSELVIIEQLTTLIVRGRRLRQAGRGADAEMIARLIMRGMGKLGIRPGTAKPDPLKAIDQHVARQRAAAQAAQSAPAVPEQPAADTRATGLANASDGRP